MKSVMFAALLVSLLPVAAHAGPCQDDIARIDKALATRDIPAEAKSQAEDMRNQAVQLCGAGNEQEGLDVTAEAKALLGIE